MLRGPHFASSSSSSNVRSSRITSSGSLSDVVFTHVLHDERLPLILTTSYATSAAACFPARTPA